MAKIKWAFFLIGLGMVVWLAWPQYPTKVKGADRFALGAIEWVNVEYYRGNMDKAVMQNILLDFMMRNLSKEVK